jgi:hypothetical protein
MYSNENKGVIKDYVTLNNGNVILVSGSATPAQVSGVYTFNIGSQYFTNQRANQCSVRVVGGLIRTSVAYDGLTLTYDNGTYNSPSKVLGHAIPVNNKTEDNKVLHITPQPIELYCNARPNQINIGLYGTDGVNDVGDAIAFSLVLEFSYYDVEATAKCLMDGYTPTL